MSLTKEQRERLERIADPDVVAALYEIDRLTAKRDDLFVPRSRLDAAREAVKIVDANLLEQRARAEKAEADLDASRRQVAALREVLENTRDAILSLLPNDLGALPADQRSAYDDDVADVDAADAALADTETAARGYVRVEDVLDGILGVASDKGWHTGALDKVLWVFAESRGLTWPHGAPKGGAT